MKYSILLTPILAIAFSSCEVNRGTMADGSKYLSMSVLENSTDEETAITPNSYQRRVIGKDQTTGGKIAGNTILGAIAVTKISEAVSEVVQARNATKVAEIQGATDAAQISSDEAIRLQELANEAALAEMEAGAVIP